jgi:hypothetical protein
LPDAKIRAVVFGSLILMITAAKRCPSQKAHVSCSPKRILPKSLSLNGKLDTGGDTIRIANKSYADRAQRKIDYKTTSSWVCMLFYNTHS